MKSSCEHVGNVPGHSSVDKTSLGRNRNSLNGDLHDLACGGVGKSIQNGGNHKMFLLSAMEKMERRSQKTKDRLTTEFRNAMEGMEIKKRKTKEMLTKATTEILYAIEESDQKSQKNRDCKGGRVIPYDAVAHFREPYAYNATCGSILEMLFLQRYWIWLSKKVPLSIMPCTITFFGLAINICCCLVLLRYSPDAKSEAPSWAFYLCAIGMFVYQTLDALDGKQCNKVQETHLEEMSDHGSDSLSCSFVTVAVMVALQLGSNPLLLATFFMLDLMAFYSAHWQTHVTDVVVFRKIDISEAQILIVVIHIVTGMFGQGIWQYKIDWLLGLEARQVLIFSTMIVTLVALLGNLRIIAGGCTPLDELVSLPRRTGVKILYPAIPIISWGLLLLLTYHLTTLCQSAPCLFCVLFGFAFSKLLVKLQISNLGKVDCEIVDSVLIGPILLCINGRLDLVPEHTALLSALVFTIMDFLRHVTYLCWDVCDFQDVYVFCLKYPLGHPKNKAGSRGIYLNGLNNEQVKSRLNLQQRKPSTNGHQ